MSEDSRNRRSGGIRRRTDAALSERRARERLAIVSHEMRAPIGAVIAISDLLLGDSLNAAQKRRVELLRMAATHLMGVASDLVDDSSIDHGRFRARPRPFEPRRLVRQLAALFQPLIAGRSMSLHTEVSPSVAEEVVADADRIRQVLINLINDALKYRAEGAITIRVRVAGEGDALAFEVCDGARPGDGPASPVARPVGDEAEAGLGLWISRSVAEALGGALAIDDRPQGRRATLTVPAGVLRPYRQPLRTPQSADASAAPAQRAVPRDAARSAIAGSAVLVVDDSLVGRALMRSVLETFGIRADVVSSGPEAAARAAVRSYDIVLWDIAGPPRAGQVPAADFAPLFGAGCPPLVAVSAAARPEDMAQFTDWVMKPFTPRELYRTLLARLSPNAAVEAGE